MNTTTLRARARVRNLLALSAGLFTCLLAGPAGAGEIVNYVLTDHLGSPAIIQDASRVLIKQEIFDPYGDAVLSPNDSGIGYTGHMSDGDTGLVYMQARYYDPQIGWFLSTDPVTFTPDKPQQFNRYWYANGNPYLYTDPDGRFGLLKQAIKFIAKGGDAAATFSGIAEDVATLANPVATGGQKALAVVSLASEVFSPVSLKDGKAIAEGIEGALRHGDDAAGAAKAAPDFVVSSGGTAYPVPSGATGPVPVNSSGKQTGSAFVGGSGGTNGQVDTMRIMDATPARGNAPAYGNGYIKYENPNGQGVNPYSGQTVSKADAHHPIE